MEISGAAVARFGLLLTAVKSGDVAQAAEMALSIPAPDRAAINETLAEYGMDLRALLATLAAQGASR